MYDAFVIRLTKDEKAACEAKLTGLSQGKPIPDEITKEMPEEVRYNFDNSVTIVHEL